MADEKKDLTLDDIAKECVNKITFDINLRSGFGAAYRMIDPTMKEEILAGWVHSVKEVLEKSGLTIAISTKPATLPTSPQIGAK